MYESLRGRSPGAIEKNVSAPAWGPGIASPGALKYYLNNYRIFNSDILQPYSGRPEIEKEFFF